MKDSGIEWLGEIPAHWETIQQRRLIERIEQGWSPQAHDREPVSDEVSVLRLSAIRSGKFRPSERKALPDIAIGDLLELPVVADGDFLLTRANTPDLVGDCAIAKGVANTIFSDLIYRLTFNHRIQKRFALFALLATSTRAQIHSDARGTSMTMAKISHGHIKSWWLALPPRNEQVQISEFLEDRETDFALQSAEIEKAHRILLERRAALISAAVTGKIDVRVLVEQDKMEAA
jgi:type I restriction enzyme S subunit